MGHHRVATPFHSRTYRKISLESGGPCRIARVTMPNSHARFFPPTAEKCLRVQMYHQPVHALQQMTMVEIFDTHSRWLHFLRRRFEALLFLQHTVLEIILLRYLRLPVYRTSWGERCRLVTFLLYSSVGLCSLFACYVPQNDCWQLRFYILEQTEKKKWPLRPVQNGVVNRPMKGDRMVSVNHFVRGMCRLLHPLTWRIYTK